MRTQGWPDQPTQDLINNTVKRHVVNCNLKVKVFHQLQISHQHLEGVLQLSAYLPAELGEVERERSFLTDLQIIHNLTEVQFTLIFMSNMKDNSA